jgi:hypothetical protein
MTYRDFKIYLISLAILLGGCGKGLFDAGSLQTREIAINEDFSRIIVNKTFDITLVQDTVIRVKITAGKNLLPDISIEVKDYILYLDNSIRYNWTRNYEKIKIEMHLKSIPVLQIMEPSHIITKDTFQTENFYLEDWGKFSDVNVIVHANNVAIGTSEDNFGRICISGKTANTNISVKGSCFVYADGLESQYCNIESGSIGDIYVNVLNTLNVSINSTGHVYYRGQPSQIIYQTQSSSDKLIKISK